MEPKTDSTSWLQRMRARLRRSDHSRLVAVICVVLLVAGFVVLARVVDEGPVTDSERATRDFLQAVRDGDCERIRELTNSYRLAAPGPEASALLRCDGYFFGNEDIDITEVRSDSNDDETDVPDAFAAISVDGEVFAWSFGFRRSPDGLRLTGLTTHAGEIGEE